MSLQLCPSCGRRSMTWSIDEEVSPLTPWYCSFCRYSALEDESREPTGPTCGAEKSYLLRFDSTDSFLYCFTCQSRSPGADVA